MQIYVGTPQQVMDIIENRRTLKIKTFQFGKTAALLHAAERIGVVDVINQTVKKKKVQGLSVGEYCLLMIAARANGKLSRNKVEDFFGNSFLKFCMAPKYQLSSQNCLNQLKRLDDKTIAEIEITLTKNLMQLGISPTRLIFDTTNRYNYIQHGEELPKKAKSKHKRYDKNCIGLALAVNDENLLFMSESYPANEADSNVFHRVFEAICQRLERLTIDMEELTLIFDRGINSKDNITTILEKMHVVGALPRNIAGELLKHSIERFEPVYTTTKGHTILGYRTTGTYYDQDLVVVVQYSSRTKKRQMMTYKKRKRKILEEFEKLRRSCHRKGKGRKPSEKGIMNRLADLIPKPLRGVFDYGLEFLADGHPCPWLEIKSDAEEKLLSSFGKTAVFTDDHSLPTETILRAYNSKWMIEDDFKWFNDKVVMPLWPFYVRKDLSLRGHIFLCVLGLMLYRYLLWELSDCDYSIQSLVETLDDLRLALVVEGSRKARFMMEEMNKTSSKIFSKLDLYRFVPE